MKKSDALGCALLALAPFALHGYDLDPDSLLDKEAAKPFLLSVGTFDAPRPAAFDLRTVYTFLDLKIAGLDAVVTYHPRAQGDLFLAGAQGGTYGSRYVALGVQADWKVQLSSPSAGRSAPLPSLQPFVRLEVAAPLATPVKGDASDELRKALAPSFQVALYGGIRF